MSDGSNDISRDRDRARGESRSIFYTGLVDYLKHQTKKNYSRLKKLAEETDAIPQGYFGSPTSLAQNLDEVIELLKAGDKPQWARLSIASTAAYQELRDMSPFSDKGFITVDYKNPNVSIPGIEILLHQRISQQEEPSARYVLAYNPDSLKDVLDQAEVIPL